MQSLPSRLHGTYGVKTNQSDILKTCLVWGLPALRCIKGHRCRQRARVAVDDESAPYFNISRRLFVGGGTVLISSGQQAIGNEVGMGSKTVISPNLAPDQSKYDPSDPDLRAAAKLLQDALGAEDVVTEERLWTQIIDEYGNLDKNWVPDLVGRAVANRGNARSRMGRLEDALSDYNRSIELCPWSVDPVLNRGVVYEAMGRFQEAVDDYKAIIAVDSKDPAAWNNLGNAYAGLGKYEDAVENYGRAVGLAPKFAFASANRSIALFQLGQEREAVRDFRNLLRRYPDFPDVRAALVAALWKLGMEEEAETEWLRVEDPRYKDKSWLLYERRWPPKLVDSLGDFINIREPNPT